MSSDPRFSRIRSDPRFRKPRKDKVKVIVDERFKGIFEGEDEKQRKRGKAATVDKYGRAVPKTKKKDDMRRFYKLHNANEEDNEDAYGASTSKAPDYARGQLLMESSDEDEFRVKPSKALASDELDSEEDLPEEVKLGPESSHLKPSVAPKTFGEEDEDEMPEVNLDESEFAGLEAQATAYSKSDTAQEEAKRSNVAAGDETSRLAIVNLDWDHVRSHHLFKIFYSIISVDPASSTRHPAKVARVRVYPSEFGKERIAREEKEGPPPELFKRKDEDSEEDVGAETIYEIGDADKGDYDDEALRKYQLERLRYHYAIAEFDSPSTAHLVYSGLDGAELGWSANVFDLSYVPENMGFDDDFRDECTEDPGVMKPLDFSTDALRHSKVKLTWDDDDPERVVITRRKLTKQQANEEDFRAYIASSPSGEGSEVDSEDDYERNAGRPNSSNLEESKLDSELKPKKGKHSASALRALLLDPSNAEELPEGWGGSERSKDGEIRVTFAPGLSTNAPVGDNDEDHETTLERYMRRQREKKAEKKAKREAKLAAQSGGLDPKAEAAGSKTVEGDGFFGDDADGETVKTKGKEGSSEVVNDSISASLAAADEPLVDDERRHFSMRDILETEKKSRWKKFKKRGHQDERELQVGENFTIDVKDDRFKALHDESEFAIDPTNPQFKSTAAMKALLQERAERQKQKKRVPVPEPQAIKKKSDFLNQNDIQSLVESVKRKSVATPNDTQDGDTKTKRRKV